MFPEYCLNVPWIHPLMFPDSSLIPPCLFRWLFRWLFPWLFLEGSLNVPWMFFESSLSDVPWILPLMFPESSLNLPWIFPESSLWCSLESPPAVAPKGVGGHRWGFLWGHWGGFEGVLMFWFFDVLGFLMFYVSCFGGFGFFRKQLKAEEITAITTLLGFDLSHLLVLHTIPNFVYIIFRCYIRMLQPYMGVTLSACGCCIPL